MEDHEIVWMYWERKEDAVAFSAEKYGGYCRKVAMGILEDPGDAEECVNDTWLSAWNAIPPHRPENLAAFLGKLTRNLAFNRYQARQAGKRGGGETTLALQELGECVSGGEDAAGQAEAAELREAISAFLAGLPPAKRGIFVRRYWYVDPVADIARRFGMTENGTSAALSRLRKGLRAYLTERGFDL